METDPQHIETKKFIELDAKDAPSSTVQWDTAQLETDTVQIIDPASGQKRVIRSFFFRSVPLPKGTPKPTKLQVVESYKRLIGNMLWADGLAPLVDETIQLYTKAEASKFKTLRAKFRQEKADFVIMVMCEARLGQNIIETASTAS